MSRDGGLDVGRLGDEFGAWFLDDERRAAGRLTARRAPFPRLFSPIQVNRLRLKNRIVMGPMGNISVAAESGRPSDRMVRYFAERAEGGAGLITSGLVPVGQKVDPSLTEAGGLSYFPRIDRSRSVFAGWRDITAACHAFGARFFIQLTPGLGRVGSPQCLQTRHRPPVSASWNPNFYLPSIPCRPLADWECRRIVKAAGQAAVDARAMEIDGVYLHGHEGYLLDQLTNPAFNRRRRGRYADWQRFGLDLVEEIRRRTGPDYPIMYRIDLTAALGETYGERLGTVRSLRAFGNERTVEMTLAFMTNLVRAGVDLFDVDLGCYDNWWLPHPPTFMPPGCFLEVARTARAWLGDQGIRSNAGHEVPVVAVGKLGSPDVCEQALTDGDCDLVMLARPLLADPDWPRKAYAGKVDEIVPCIGDQEGCVHEFVAGGHPQCSVNPRAGFEDVFPAELPAARRPRRIAVVGAGPAGIVCATTAARRGHEVTLFERSAQPGGMLVPGSVPRAKLDVASYLDYLRGLVERTSREAGLTVRLETEATPEGLAAEGYDVVVACTGGVAVHPPVDGVDDPRVVDAVDLLRAPDDLPDAERVVVVGGGAVGCEVAFWLAGEHGRRVTVIEMLPHLMKDNCTANRGYLLHYLERLGVRLLNCARLEAVTGEGVAVRRNVASGVPDPYCTWTPVLPDNMAVPFARPLVVDEVRETLAADLVVLATGRVPDAALFEDCLQRHVAPEVHAIGDGFTVAKVLEAVRAGYTLGRRL
ncbi:MAG TPA: FAD-dependent oxidoreductase [Thermoleophilia bacterium]|nr:FAD-dependent oxidoreductase [Thermoleophilia bacterium]